MSLFGQVLKDWNPISLISRSRESTPDSTGTALGVIPPLRYITPGTSPDYSPAKNLLNATPTQALYSDQHASPPDTGSALDKIKSFFQWEWDIGKNFLPGGPLSGPIPGSTFALNLGRDNLASNVGGFFGGGLENAANTAKYVFYTIIVVGGVILFGYVRNALR